MGTRLQVYPSPHTALAMNMPDFNFTQFSQQCYKILSHLLTSPQGMSLSGGEQAEAQKKIIEGLQTSYAHTSKQYHVCTDTFGSIATAFPNGGSTLSHRCRENSTATRENLA